MLSAAVLRPTHAPHARAAAQRAYACMAAREAMRALYAELALYPKPGLVSFVDNGSHTDMDAATFMRSLFSLRHYFRDITLAGSDAAPFAVLRELAIAAEERMLKATRGVNTHRGAIFSLGMLCAAAGRARARGIARTPEALRAVLLIEWGEALAAHSVDSSGAGATVAHSSAPAGGAAAAESHGQQVARVYGASGAREEGALGFPSVFTVGLPALRAAFDAGRPMRLARVDALFALMAHMSDTNVLHRGGPDAADLVRTMSQRFLVNGGTAASNWQQEAVRCHQAFVASRISPGGAADLLAASCLLDVLTR